MKKLYTVDSFKKKLDSTTWWIKKVNRKEIYYYAPEHTSFEMRHFKKRVQWVYICTNWCMFWNVSMLCHVILSPKWILINLKLCLLKLRSVLVLFLWSSTCQPTCGSISFFLYIAVFIIQKAANRKIYIHITKHISENA